jgi:SAM-dependent methyltransferase
LPRTSRLTATDLNEPMLAYARDRIGPDRRLHWRQADALDLPFDDGEFDAVVCQFGIMFFPDKPRAVREFHRVLAPGGHLLFSVWDSFEHNPVAAAIHASIAEVLPENPPAFYQIPYGYHDIDELRALTTSAGFSSVRVEAVDFTGESSSAAAAARGLVHGNPVVNAIRERGLAYVDEIESLTAERLATDYGDNPLRVPIRALVVTATRS